MTFLNTNGSIVSFGKTPTPVSERAEREKSSTPCSPFRRMGTGSDGYIRRMPILCDLYRRLFETHADLPHVVQERSVQTLPNIQKSKVEKTTSRYVQCLRSDRGKEYFSNALTTYL